MLHRGIEYAVRMSLGCKEWIWTLSTIEGRIINGHHKGTRDDALAAGRRAIDRWLAKHNGGQDYEQTTQIGPGSSQLAVPLEDFPTAASDPQTLRR
jgi:hypothetical protein